MCLKTSQYDVLLNFVVQLRTLTPRFCFCLGWIMMALLEPGQELDKAEEFLDLNNNRMNVNTCSSFCVHICTKMVGVSFLIRLSRETRVDSGQILTLNGLKSFSNYTNYKV